mmetsp:Transcript_16879/g.58911  ORF Transcript_16879/g.58911 Transcript_16879/m.58911 type:complete len:400 (+) Transcript_16879:523-1722(+)
MGTEGRACPDKGGEVCGRGGRAQEAPGSRARQSRARGIASHGRGGPGQFGGSAGVCRDFGGGSSGAAGGGGAGPGHRAGLAGGHGGHRRRGGDRGRAAPTSLPRPRAIRAAPRCPRGGRHRGPRTAGGLPRRRRAPRRGGRLGRSANLLHSDPGTNGHDSKGVGEPFVGALRRHLALPSPRDARGLWCRGLWQHAYTRFFAKHRGRICVGGHLAASGCQQRRCHSGLCGFLEEHCLRGRHMGGSHAEGVPALEDRSTQGFAALRRGACFRNVLLKADERVGKDRRTRPAEAEIQRALRCSAAQCRAIRIYQDHTFDLGRGSLRRACMLLGADTRGACGEPEAGDHGQFWFVGGCRGLTAGTRAHRCLLADPRPRCCTLGRCSATGARCAFGAAGLHSQE